MTRWNWNLCILFVFAAYITSLRAQERDQDPDQEQVAMARVTDLNDAPIAEAFIYRLDSLDGSEEDSHVAVTDDAGYFRFPISTSGNDPNGNIAFIFHPDFVLAALNLDVLPARVRLHSNRKREIKVLDHRGDAVSHARVSPWRLFFEEEFVEATLPRALADRTAVLTQDDGRAILNGTLEESLNQVLVEADGYGAQVFYLNKERQSRHLVELQLSKTVPLELNVQVADQPANGFRVVDEMGLIFHRGVKYKHTQPCSIVLNQPVGASGRVLVEHALASHAFTLKFLDESNRTRGLARVDIAEEGSSRPLNIKLRKSIDEIGQTKYVQIIDSVDGGPVSDFDVTFSSPDWPYEKVHASSDLHGRVTLKLLPGRWFVEGRRAPEGYCAWLIQDPVIHANSSIIDVSDQEGEHLLDLMAVRGKKVNGTLEGIDLALHRSRKIVTTWRDEQRAGQRAGQTYGRIHPDSTFDVWIPINATAQAFYLLPYSDQSAALTVESQEPLVLTVSPST